jgi:large subunit ribosomal protein L13
MKEIDAKGKSLGRVASEAAKMLMGKDTPAYEPHLVQGSGVHIVNAGSINLSEKKMKQKQYGRYSGYPGGLRFESLEQVLAKKGFAEAFRKAVYGMLPNNKLRAPMMKKLKVTE